MFSFCNIFSDRFTRQISYQRRSWLEITSRRWSKCKMKKLIFDKNMTFPLFGLVLLHVRVFLWATWLSADTLNFISPFRHSEFMSSSLDNKKVEKMEQKGNKLRIKRRLGEQVYHLTTPYFCSKTKKFSIGWSFWRLSSAFGLFGSSVISGVTNRGNPFHSAGSLLLLS